MNHFTSTLRRASLTVAMLTVASSFATAQTPAPTPATEPAQNSAGQTPAAAPGLATKTTHYKRNGALIGLAAGATLGIAGGWDQCQNGSNCSPAVVGSVIWGAIGAGVGAWIGSAMTPKPLNRTAVRLGSPSFTEFIDGQRLAVTTVDGRRITGKFTVTQGGLRTASSGEVLFTQITKVERTSNRIAKGFLFGLIPGVGIGILGWAGSCEDQCNQGALLVPMLVGAGAGAAIGAAMDATHRDADVLFESKPKAPTSNKTMTVAPILSRTRKGVTFSMTWR